MGIARREAFGVRQLAAALFFCANNVSVPTSASEGYLHGLQQPPIGTTGNLRATPQSGGKTQTASLSLYQTQYQRPYRCDRITGCQSSRYRETYQAHRLEISANMNDF
ncbi:MAG: hypothetical protein GX456_13825 [Verrucomicrobia bacterium]|nr:hypothetical protein [Verrucomicrobiota bacterium]